MINEITNLLENARKELTSFQKVVRKYPKGHVHYKIKARRLQLEITGILKKIRKYSSIDTSEIDSEINNFLRLQSVDSRNCEELIEKINYTLQDFELSKEQTSVQFTERIYDKNSPFDFHNDLREIINQSKDYLFIIEPFVTDHLLEVTLKDLNKNINLKIITNSNNYDKRGKFEKLANMFRVQQSGGFEVRESEDIHDRVVFIDNKGGWVLGQSIKDAGKKPTYLIKLQDFKRLEGIYDKIWKQSKKIR